MKTPLSTADMGVFFEPSHFELAEQLSGVAAELDRSAGAAAVARAMGKDFDLYRFFVENPIDLRAVCLIRELLGYSSPLADAIFAVHGLGTFPVAFVGNDGQKEHYLPRCRSGEQIGGFALTEPNAGSDIASMQTSATLEGQEYVLRGEKTLISNVGIASYYIVFASVDRSVGRKGITAFLVESGTAGLLESTIELATPHPFGALSFHDCRIPASALLGEEGQGFSVAMTTLDAFRVSVGSAANGMARRAFDEARNWVKERRQFGGVLAELQLVQSQLAEMATELDAARLLVWRAAHCRDRGKERARTEAAMAKLYATEAAQRIVDQAVQLFGGRGVILGEVVEQLYRAVRPLRIYEGTSEIQKLIIARGVLGDKG